MACHELVEWSVIEGPVLSDRRESKGAKSKRVYRRERGQRVEWAAISFYEQPTTNCQLPFLLRSTINSPPLYFERLYCQKSGRQDLNLRPLRPERSALAKLSYSPGSMEFYIIPKFHLNCKVQSHVQVISDYFVSVQVAELCAGYGVVIARCGADCRLWHHDCKVQVCVRVARSWWEVIRGLWWTGPIRSK